MRGFIGCLCALLTTSLGAADNSAGLYQVRSRLIMPNLAENLRYAKQTEQHCLADVGDDTFDYSVLLPILSHVSLANCRLNKTLQQENVVNFQLVCSGERNATGVARINIGKNKINSQLDIQMGGKNMTFSQYSEAIRQQDCDL